MRMDADEHGFFLARTPGKTLPEASLRHAPKALAPRRAPEGGEAISRGRVGDCLGRSAPSL
jgi:hypothetical protein